MLNEISTETENILHCRENIRLTLKDAIGIVSLMEGIAVRSWKELSIKEVYT